MTYIRYFLTICRHKWFVFRAGLVCNAPLWLLLIHDLSKFRPSEFFPYARRFRGNYPDRGATIMKAFTEGLPKRPRSQEDVDAEFTVAFLRHVQRNPHHWEAWCVIPKGEGAVKTLPMPEKYIREMVADWWAAGRTYNGQWGAVGWYRDNKDKMLLHDDTRYLVERVLLESAAWFCGDDSLLVKQEANIHAIRDLQTTVHLTECD